VIDFAAEYDTRTRTPEHPAIMAGWARDSAALRASHPFSEIDIAYGPTPRQALDVFWPNATHDAPMALFIHGGYWQALDKSWFSHLAQGFLAHGVAVAIPSYDLCPDVTLSVLTEQVRDATAFLARRHGRALLASGHSAGGHLTAMLMATDWRAKGLPAGTVRAGLTISGLFDLPPLVHTPLNIKIGLDETEAKKLSPMFFPAPGLPLHAIVGGAETAEFHRQSREMAAAWGGTWEAAPGENHFSVIAPLADPNSGMVRRALSLMTP
jgi:arylformamidase